MKIAIFISLIMIMMSSKTYAGVWVPYPSGGGSSSGTSCYLVAFNTASYGARHLLGNGIVSAGTFTGYLRGAPNPSISGGSRHYSCSNWGTPSTGDCAWYYAFNTSTSTNYIFSTVGVFALPIISAQAIACF
jgi:hypothetical protein